MVELPPVGGDHVGGHPQGHGVLEFRHHFPAGEAGFRTGGVFDVAQDPFHGLAQPDGFFQAPGPIGIDVDPGIGEGFLQGPAGVHFVGTFHNPALQLEVPETVLFVKDLGFFHHLFMGEDFSPAVPEPGIRAVGFIQVGQVRFILVGHIEQIAQHFHLVPLLAFRQQFAHGNAQILAQQIQQGTFQSPFRPDHKFQFGDVQGLYTFPIIPCRFFAPSVDSAQDGPVFADFLSHHQRDVAFQTFFRIFAPVDFSDAFMTGIVVENYQIPGEKRCMSPAQGHFHAVISRYGDDFHIGYNRCTCH